MGEKMKCIDCTAALHADPRPFAGFPNGVDEGTKFGRFFGRQVSIYLRDMDVDYIWLSNSFGFGRSPYATGGVGQFFDGLEISSPKECQDQCRHPGFLGVCSGRRSEILRSNAEVQISLWG